MAHSQVAAAQQLQDERFIRSVAVETGVSAEASRRALTIINAGLNRWTRALMSKVCRAPMNYRDFAEEYEADIRWLIWSTLVRYVPQMAATYPDDDELGRRVNVYASQVLSKTARQAFYASISSCGNWSLSLGTAGEIQYWNSGARAHADVAHEAEGGVHGIDPAVLLEALEDENLERVEVERRIEELRPTLTAVQYRTLRLVLVDRLELSVVAATCGENTSVKAVNRRLDRIMEHLSGKPKKAPSKAKAALIHGKLAELKTAERND